MKGYIFPGTEDLPDPVVIGVRPLTPDEAVQAQQRAWRYIEQRAAELTQAAVDLLEGYPELLERETHRQALAIAVRDPEDGRPFFKSAEQVRELDTRTCSILLQLCTDEVVNAPLH